MTNEETIKEIRERICGEKPIQHFCDDSCMYSIEECPFGIAIEDLEKAEKYKYHDLRKNPEDLPKEGKYGFSEPVLAYDWADYGVCRYDFKKNKWYTRDLNLRDEYDSCYSSDIVAWRQIDPFEEERK